MLGGLPVATHRMFWLTLTADRVGLEVYVNDMPVARLPRTGGRRMPINEFVRPGPNRLEVRMARSLDPAEAETPRDGAFAIGVEERIYEGDDLAGSAILLNRDVNYPQTALVPGGVLFADAFQTTSAGLPSLERFTPIGPLERQIIIAALAQAADWWRSGDLARLLDWMDDYIRDFVAAYPTETRDGYREDFERMGRFFLSERQVVFDPVHLDLMLCGGGRLVDCRTAGAEAAAIRLVAPDEDIYDFWTIVGVLDGKAVLLR